MKHARDDYDRIQDPAGLIPADEPVFLLRGQDELACKAVAYYATLCEQVQAAEVAAKARAHADLMAAWPKKKVPDLPAAPECPDCNGTGLRDSGGVLPWGEAAMVPCDCAVPAPAYTHPDDLAVDRFAAEMKEKLAEKRDQGYGGWDDPAHCSTEFLARLLRDHIAKGDPVDVGNFAMMLFNRGGRTNEAPAPVDAVDALRELVNEIDGLVGESTGVYGLHLNGDPAPWDELLPGGRFERLDSLDRARAALAAADQEIGK